MQSAHYLLSDELVVARTDPPLLGFLVFQIDDHVLELFQDFGLTQGKQGPFRPVFRKGDDHVFDLSARQFGRHIKRRRGTHREGKSRSEQYTLVSSPILPGCPAVKLGTHLVTPQEPFSLLDVLPPRPGMQELRDPVIPNMVC
jgi:hypothetical protein